MTVSVVDPNIKTDSDLSHTDDSDFKIEWFSGTGSGGQHRNKKQNSCRMTHIPTGLVETRQGRKRESNLKQAKGALLERLNNAKESQAKGKLASIRKNQVGSGMRGDKIRTYRFQDDKVTDHNTGKKAKCSKVMKGHFNLLWN